MLPVTTIIRRIRSRLHDLENINYTDEEILDALNMGLRFIRRAIVDIRPSLLIETYEGTIAAGERFIKLPFRPLKIVHITMGDKIIKSEMIDTSPPMYQNYNQVWHNATPIYTTKKVDTYSEAGIKQTELAHKVMDKNDLTGIPKEFYLTGEKTIHFVPIPNQKMKFTMMYVPDIEELTIEDKSPLLTEMDDFLVEYAAIRISIADEFSMAEEAQIMSNIYQQIQRIVQPPPVGFVVKGYY